MSLCLIVPLPVKVIPLLEPRVKVPVVFSVPPLKIMLSASAVPGVAPKLALEEIEIIPAASVVEPEYVFDPESVRVPEPTLINAPAPDITPETVSFPESPVVRVIEPASSTAPDPLKDCIVSVASTSYVPEFITSVVSAKVPETVSVPAEIVVSPV